MRLLKPIRFLAQKIIDGLIKMRYLSDPQNFLIKKNLTIMFEIDTAKYKRIIIVKR